MSKTIRKFRGKEYRQGHEPCELELARIRAERLQRTMDHRLDDIDDEIDDLIKHLQREERHANRIRSALRAAAELEQEEMGYGKQ